MIPQWEQNIINNKHKEFVYAIEWLNPQEEVIDEVIIDVISGNVNFDGTNNSRRICDLILKNIDKKYIPSPTSPLWINNKFKLKCGYKYSGGNLFYNQGIYLLGNPNLLSHPTQKEVTVRGLDKWTSLDGTLSGKLKNKYIIPVYSRVDDAMKTLIEEEIGESKFIIDECDEELPYDIEKEPGTTYADLILEICNIVSYEAFYDNNGYFRFRKALQPEDYISTSVSWEYTTSGLYLEANRELHWDEIRNSIRVIGDTLDNGILISAIAQDLSDGEFSIPNIGERPETIEDINIYTNELAQARANWELQQSIMMAETENVKLVPNFSHKIDDVIQIIDENNGSYGNYAIRQISYNLGYDAVMNLGAWAIRNWGE